MSDGSLFSKQLKHNIYIGNTRKRKSANRTRKKNPPEYNYFTILTTIAKVPKEALKILHKICNYVEVFRNNKSKKRDKIRN